MACFDRLDDFDSWGFVICAACGTSPCANNKPRQCRETSFCSVAMLPMYIYIYIYLRFLRLLHVVLGNREPRVVKISLND